MTFKTKNKILIAQDKKNTIEFGEKLKVGEFTVPGPGEFEVNGTLISSPEENIYSIRSDDVHVLYWRALNGQPKVASETLGSIDAMVLELGEKTTIKDVAATVNDLEPGNIVLSKPDRKDELVKAEGLPTQEVETWKVEPGAADKDRELILLPCSQS